MTLLYATSLHFPSKLANRIQTVAMAAVFAEALGDRFIFGIGENTNATPLPGRVVESGRAHSFFRALTFLRHAAREGVTHVYCREEKLMFFLVLLAPLIAPRVSCCYEIHHMAHARTWWHRIMLARTPALVSLTAAMRDELVRTHGYRGETLIAHDAANPRLFDIPLSKEAARRELGLPLEKRIALYAGSIDRWKGGGTFYESAAHLDDSYLLLFIGGKPGWVEEFEAEHVKQKRVVMLGQKDYATELPRYLKAADVAVLPNTAREEISRICTSPLKLFAYMASGAPIVASDVPALREVISERSAVFVTPDDPVALAGGIRALAEDPVRAAALAAVAKEDARQYTWEKRAERILSFIA